MKTVGIFPASGGLGTSTYAHLAKLIPPHHIILICRHPEKIPQGYADSGVRVREASYGASEDELKEAFADIDVLLLISFPGHLREYRVKLQLPAIDAAQAAGVSHIIYTSLAFSSPSKAVVMHSHLDTEAHLQTAASRSNGTLNYTILRAGLYAEAVPMFAASFPSASTAGRNEVRIPHAGDGPGVAWTRRDDLAEAGARILASVAGEGEGADRFRDRTVLLTGPRAWSLTESVAVVGKLVGRPTVRIVEVSLDEYAAQPDVLANFGSEDNARSWATVWEAIQDGEAAAVSPELGEVLCREPVGFEECAKEIWGGDTGDASKEANR